jgi:hypothetical protein
VRALSLDSRLTIPLVHFALVILEIGSSEPFAQAGLEPSFSQSQPLKQLGL